MRDLKIKTIIELKVFTILLLAKTFNKICKKKKIIKIIAKTIYNIALKGLKKTLF